MKHDRIGTVMEEAQKFWIADPDGADEPASGRRLGLAPAEAESMQGDWVALELPRTGANIRSGETFGFVTTDRATHDLRAPFAFRVLEVNSRAVENPAVARFSPTGEGWLLLVQPAMPS